MRLAYVDESATADRYFLGAVVMDGDCALSLGDALDAVMAKASSTYPGLSVTTELHGHSIFHGKDEWKGIAPRARISVYDQALRAIDEHPIEIYLRGIDTDRQRTRYPNPFPPHDVVLQHLLERLDEHIFEPVLVIADEVHDHDRVRHRSNLRSFRRSGTPGYRSSYLPRIIDTLHYADSRHSRLIQAADLVTFLYVRITRRTESDPRAARANARLWARVSPLITHAQTWRP